MKAEEIDGWMTIKELEVLRTISYQLGNIVEVGCWKGRSTRAFLEGKQQANISGGARGLVFAVDHWKGSEDERETFHAEVKEKDIFEEFLRNMYGYYEDLRVMRGDSVSMAKCFEVDEVDAVFLDGCHQEKDVLNDLEAWEPKAKRLIFGHDWWDERVQRAVMNYFERKPPEYFEGGLKKISVVAETSIWYVKKG